MKQAARTLKNSRGEQISPRFLATKLMMSISDVVCPRSARLALGVSQGLMGLWLARAVGRPRPWSRWTVRDWEARSNRHPMTSQASEAYRRLLMDILLSRGLFLFRRGRGEWNYRVVRVCRRGHVYRVSRLRDRCHRCEAKNGR